MFSDVNCLVLQFVTELDASQAFKRSQGLDFKQVTLKEAGEESIVYRLFHQQLFGDLATHRGKPWLTFENESCIV